MLRKQVRNHCRGAQHRVNYAALEALVTLPLPTTDQAAPERGTATEESIEEGDALHFQRMLAWYRDYFSESTASILVPIGALRALQRVSEPEDLPGEMAAFGISGSMSGGLKRLFLSHPPLEERIAALESGRGESI